MDIYAHRGASAHAPENTMEAYKMAFDQYHADGIEIDVHYSKDGEMVIMHDFDLSRTTNGSGMIFTKTLSELKALSASTHYTGEGSYPGAKIPTLNEVLELVAEKGKKINIELKAGSFLYPKIEERIIEMVYDYNLQSKTLLSSFDHISMVRAKEIDSKIKTGILSDCRMYQTTDYVLKTGADAYNGLYAAFTPEEVISLKEAGLMVNCYTPNEEKEIQAMIQLGMDIIITNYPERGIKLRDQLTGKH